MDLPPNHKPVGKKLTAKRERISSSEAACEGKPTYNNGAEAFRALRHRNHRLSKKQRSYLMPYHCPFCGRYHIGGNG